DRNVTGVQTCALPIYVVIVHGSPVDLWGTVEVDALLLPPFALVRQTAGEGVPVVTRLGRPADLGDGGQPWEGHELDVIHATQGFREQLGLDAEAVVLTDTVHGFSRVPGVGFLERGRARPAQAELGVLVVLLVHVRPVRG